ncbi:MAG: HAD-IB family hydrolase [Motiliproteus sp.]|nr:HAD-IB family hydrolase [Motiliproteus sp.]MCW9051377.1 HAD-IB family hydrolase [Motiliproteus sp.]
MSLAIFDLDNTLIAGDSDHAWGEFLVEQGIVDGQVYKQANDRFYEDYKRGQLDIHQYLEFALKPLTRFSTEELKSLHDGFMEAKVIPMMLPKAKALLKKHRDQGDFLLIITATNRFVTGPIANHLDVDEIMASDPEMVEGRYTGGVSGIPCYQDGKVKRLEEWLKQSGHTLEDSYFYSDSHNDIPLLEEVDHPVAVDADPQLLAHAEAKGWPSISLR